MMPKFSIITPTLQRESLVQCCESVVSQTFKDWEMLVQIDDENIDQKLWSRINPTRRIWAQECGKRHNNYGNTCRHIAWERATGEWLIHLDDDNTLSHPNALRNIASALDGIEEQWAIFPIIRHGWWFFNDPPGLCRTDTANMVIRREIARWPDIPDYTADGILCEQLKSKYPYRAFPNVEPIVNMPESREGR